VGAAMTRFLLVLCLVGLPALASADVVSASKSNVPDEPQSDGTIRVIVTVVHNAVNGDVAGPRDEVFFTKFTTRAEQEADIARQLDVRKTQITAKAAIPAGAPIQINKPADPALSTAQQYRIDLAKLIRLRTAATAGIAKAAADADALAATLNTQYSLAFFP
jgi:hypothetical protein